MLEGTFSNSSAQNGVKSEESGCTIHNESLKLDCKVKRRKYYIRDVENTKRVLQSRQRIHLVPLL